MEYVTQQYHYLESEGLRLKKTDKNINKDNKRYIIEEFQENGNIKTRKFIKVKRCTNTKNVTHIHKNQVYTSKENQETEEGK